MRDRTKLHPKLQELMNKLILLCKENGLEIGIAECVRTVAEQDALYAKGRTVPGIKVTNAKGSTYSSMHQWGIAFDFYRNDGKGAYYDKDGFFTKVGKLGKSIGLEWGGSWITIKDKPHFQLADWGSGPSKLKKLYGTPERFMATFKQKEDTSNPYQKPTVTLRKGSKGDQVKWLQFELNKNGYKLVVDGDYGNNTVNVVKSWQKSKGITSDGIAGKVTISAFN